MQEEKKRLRKPDLGFDHEPLKIKGMMTPRPPTPPPMFNKFEMEAAKMTPRPPRPSPPPRKKKPSGGASGFAVFDMDHSRPTPPPKPSSSFSTFEMSEPLRERPR